MLTSCLLNIAISYTNSSTRLSLRITVRRSTLFIGPLTLPISQVLGRTSQMHSNMGPFSTTAFSKYSATWTSRYPIGRNLQLWKKKSTKTESKNVNCRRLDNWGISRLSPMWKVSTISNMSWVWSNSNPQKTSRNPSVPWISDLQASTRNWKERIPLLSLTG